MFTSKASRSSLSFLAVFLGFLPLVPGQDGSGGMEAWVPYSLDSGWISSPLETRGIVHSSIIDVPGASWIRLEFDSVTLGGTPGGGESTILRITSLSDGAVQELRTADVEQWRNTSAYFNGSAALVEIVTDPSANPSRIELAGVRRDASSNAPETICFGVDDRIPSADARVGRVLPTGCTAWLVTEPYPLLLTAGHCSEPGDLDVAQFNVPLSNSSGAIQHPPPEDQYPIDLTSIQYEADGAGADWGVFGCFPNGITGATPHEAQGDSFEFSLPDGTVGSTLRITGYGVTDGTVSATWNQAQKTHEGPLTNDIGPLLYQVDTTGGNSGSPVFLDGTNLALGIHTHGGCNLSGNANQGTRISHGPLQAALDDPLGILQAGPPLQFEWVLPPPEVIPPQGAPIEVMVTEIGGVSVPATGLLHFDIGNGALEAPLVEIAPGVYGGSIPALTCGQYATIHVSMQSASGELVRWPRSTLEIGVRVPVATSLNSAFEDDFELDLGWTVSGDATAGAWQRGVPAGAGDRGDPTSDSDGSGSCFLTGNGAGDTDVDGGSTHLVSPPFTAGPDHWIELDLWYFNGTTPDDALVMEISTDDGANWMEIDGIGVGSSDSDGGWHERRLPLGSFLDEITPVIFRCGVADQGDGDIVEAALDGFRVVELLCGARFRRGDANLDSVIDIADPIAVLAGLFSGDPIPCASAADINDDDLVDIADPVFGLSYLFSPTATPIPDPVGVCGPDPTPGILECEATPECT